MNFFKTIKDAVVCAWQRWSDKQQQIYEDYQAAAPARREAFLKKEGLA